jgi:hypothetical protein
MLLGLNRNGPAGAMSAPVEAAIALAMQGIIQDAACRQVADRSNKLARIHRLIDDKAWTDAALALLELELPRWKLRRLACEDGEWFCSLSRGPNVPIELDDMAEAHHAFLPLAIMQALVEAWSRTRAANGNRPGRAPQVSPAVAQPVCCDNFD